MNFYSHRFMYFLYLEDFKTMFMLLLFSILLNILFYGKISLVCSAILALNGAGYLTDLFKVN